MSKGVHKHCSILNYIKHVDEELYELVQDLCIGRIFVPRRGTNGVTFLRPDAGLMKKVKALAVGENPEQAVAMLQSMVLLDHLDSVKDFEERKDSIPTFLRRVLPVASVSGDKVKLTNGAEIVPDKEFQAREDRENISVYIISKEPVPTDTAPMDMANVKPPAPKGKKGGYEYQPDQRAQAFNDVLDAYMKSDRTRRNPALEMLVCMLEWMKTNAKDSYSVVCSQLSHDTLATLAIVLRPYASNSGLYISDSVFNAFASARSSKVELFSYVKNPVNKYLEHMQVGQRLAPKMDQSGLVDSISKASAISAIQSTLASVQVDAALSARKSSPAVMLAEAELRVISAVLHQNGLEAEDRAWYVSKCTLDKPYLCTNGDMKDANVGVYWSTAYLIARSNALFYTPMSNSSSPGLVAIVNEGAMINLDADFDLTKTNVQESSNQRVEQLKSALGPLFSE